MLKTFDKRHHTIKVEAITGQPYTIDIVPELRLLSAVVTQARREAQSQHSEIKWPARSFLQALGLPIEG